MTTQLMHLVFGGELTELDKVEFADMNALDIVGIYPNYQEAYDAWKAKAQETVNDADGAVVPQATNERDGLTPV